MSPCASIQESLGAYLDAELSAAGSDAVRSHLAACPECAAAHRQLEKIQLTLGTMLAAEAARVEFAPFWRGVERRIAAQRSWHEDLIERLQAVFTAPRLAWAVPAVIVLALLTVTKWPLGGQSNNFASVDSIDAYGRNVALLREDETKTTIIWLYQNPEGENENVEEAPPSSPAF